MKHTIIILLLLSPVLLFSQIIKEEIITLPDQNRIKINPDHTWEWYNDNISDTALSTTGLSCDSILLGKYVDNSGRGDELMTSARNMRTVLRGVLYRGGANNKYNPISRRDNNNPINIEALVQLHSLGFNDIVYLYNKNFDYYYSEETLQQLKNNGINYQSIVPNDDTIAYKILSMAYSKITQKDTGLIYMHCWNGWHMSGLMSAYALMQFCDFSKFAAWEYWKQGTDNNYKGYDRIKNRIFAFTKFPDLSISISEKLKVCPCTK